jgi:N-acyl-D-aspartate/D-glutamate deacylase
VTAYFDVIIRGGTVVDGTRLPRYRADVGLRDGRIAQIGGRMIPGPDTRVLDAEGCIVAPGFVDLHTHYDAQIQWDPYCTISGWHGVTSVALGNCGFGFAPVRPDERDRAMLMMSRNEAIPLESMREGMLWDWETFPEWLDSLDRMPKGVNCIANFPVGPLMIYVMGLEEAKSRGATPEERAEMQRLLREGMEAGAAGWSVQRLGEHSAQADYDGTPMPTDTMLDIDVLALGEVLRELDAGSIQLTQATATSEDAFDEHGVSDDMRFEEQLAELSGRPMLHTPIIALDEVPDWHTMNLRWLEDCNRRGLRMYGQAVTNRDFVVISLNNFNLYDSVKSWNYAMQGTVEEQIAKLSDPAVRQQMKDEEGELVTMVTGGPLADLRVIGVDDRPELEQYLGKSLAEIAASDGRHHIDVMLDLSIATDLKAEFRGKNTVSTNPEKQGEVMASPYVVPGQSDGGAHTKFFTGGSFTTDFLCWLVRDTGTLTLEEAHYRLSYLPAQAAGFLDRGFLREGAPADIVIYNLDELRRVPDDAYEVVHDLPAGEWRRIQRSEGYHYVLVNGETTFEHGKCTGATPGRLLRHGRA